MRTLLLILILCSTSSCYRMPSDDDYSTVPCTNNSDVFRDRGTSPIPSGSF